MTIKLTIICMDYLVILVGENQLQIKTTTIVMPRTSTGPQKSFLAVSVNITFPRSFATKLRMVSREQGLAELGIPICHYCSIK